jgi:hypothetical protein
MTRTALAVAAMLALAGCAAQSEAPAERPDGAAARTATGQEPDRFTIAPDDWDVPYAGTTQDGRKFFLSDQLFVSETRNRPESAYVGLFLWKADGTFDEVRVDKVSRPEGLPPGQAGPADAQELVDARLAELGDYVLEPVDVEPFTEKVDGVRFGWKVGRYDDGDYYIGIVPGDFIVYYAPWDGLEYDT